MKPEITWKKELVTVSQLSKTIASSAFKGICLCILLAASSTTGL